MTKKFLYTTLVGAGLLAAGVLLLVGLVRQRAVNIVSTPPAPASVTTASVVTAAASASSQGYVTGMPNNLIIPSLNLNLTVIPGYYDPTTGSWTLTKSNVQFATPTTQPNNQAGNTFIYGHALSNLFGSLPKLRAGAVAIVKTDNGHTFYYTLASTKVVNPADSAQVLDYTGKPVLTLQTCVGLLYQNRELLTFNLDRVV